MIFKFKGVLAVFSECVVAFCATVPHGSFSFSVIFLSPLHNIYQKWGLKAFLPARIRYFDSLF